jgi:acyl-CoA thioester hydrolase
MSAMVSFRSVVNPADCDFLGHMNVSRYFAACSDGVFAIQSEMGLTAKDMKEGRRLSFAVVHAESNFSAELSAGDAIKLETEIMAIGSKSITFRHRLIRVDDDAIAFETLFKCVMFNLETRSAVHVPDVVRKRAVVWLVNGQDQRRN